MKQQRIKARKGTVHDYNEWDDAAGHCKEFYVLPADAESYAAMHAQIVRALERADFAATYERDATAALRAIGITAPKRGKKGSK